MKKFLTSALVLAAALALTACGPGDNKLNTGDQPVSNDFPTATLPTVLTEDQTVGTDELIFTEPTEPTEPSVTVSNEVTESDVTTTEGTAPTSATTTEPTTAPTSATTTKTAATTTVSEEPGDDETEELGWEDIPNLDEFLASLGIETGGLNAND